MSQNNPPLEIPPRDIVEHHFNVFRIGKIVGAMSRYAEAQKPVPIEWVNELAQRLRDYMREVEE